MASPLQLLLAQSFLDVPALARLCSTSRSAISLDSWKLLDKHLWIARGEDGPWNKQAIPEGPLPAAFASNAKQLWLQAGTLLGIAGRPIACPGMLERALTEVYVLGMNGLH